MDYSAKNSLVLLKVFLNFCEVIFVQEFVSAKGSTLAFGRGPGYVSNKNGSKKPPNVYFFFQNAVEQKKPSKPTKLILS